jgi:hypothetical protein
VNRRTKSTWSHYRARQKAVKSKQPAKTYTNKTSQAVLEGETMKASHVRKLIKPIDSAYSEMFSGRFYRVGTGAVSVRNHSGDAEQTVIGVHGFLENHCYFTQAYDAPTTE